MADEKGQFSSSILHWPAESPVHSAAADNLVAPLPTISPLYKKKQKKQTDVLISFHRFKPSPLLSPSLSVMGRRLELLWKAARQVKGDWVE